jgi:prepilin-type N-terminal cleavage/methylation domain-containing protein
MKITTIKNSGFTLIELLIVIGLLAALAAVLLPTLMGDRDAALNSIDKYNGAGTLRTLRQYEAMTGKLPNGLHTGLTAASSGTVMSNVSTVFKANLAASGTSGEGGIDTLSIDEAKALSEIGLTHLAYSTGEPNEHTIEETLGYVKVASGISVITLSDDWTYTPAGSEDAVEMSFNGKGPHYLEHEGYSKVIALFVAPTAQWNAAGTGWVKGFSVGMDVPATSPLPESDTFPYYIAYVGIQQGWAASDDVKSTGTVAIPHNPAPGEADESDLVDAIKTLYSGTNYSGDTWTWDNSVSGVLIGENTASSGTSTEGATVTYSLYYINPTARLLGTSNPDCVVTNP